MRKTTRFAVLIGSAALAAAAGLVLAGDDTTTPVGDGRFVVHEWGTFTSMQGADGVALEGLSREEEALPDFVYSRSLLRDCPLRDKGWKGLEVPAEHVTQKMETPVIYFHSATPRRVRVRVDFVTGLLSQWYPVSDLVGPPEGRRGAGPLDVSKIERSFLQWDVELLPKDAACPGDAPAVAKDDPWSFAREVDANWLRTLPRKAPERAGPVESERYLFYRGLGNFPLPLSAQVRADGVFVLQNRGDAAVETPIVLDVKGDKGRMREVETVPAGGGRKTQLEGGASWGPIADVEEKLKALLMRRLVAEGLHEDEARAMVRTWSRSWFRSEGTRVLWILPRAQTDALLPLSIDPKPDALVRVLVGRTEIITPEAEEEDYAALADVASGDPVRAPRGAAAIERRGRFVEPHLRRVVAAIDARKEAPRPQDAAVRQCAQGRLDKAEAIRGDGSGEEDAFGR
jgi:hypothetical protein